MIMIGLLAGTFAFFWTHTALWFYREYKERQERKTRPYIRTADLPQEQGKYYRRFPLVWRIAHLVFALSLMILTLTGMTSHARSLGDPPALRDVLRRGVDSPQVIAASGLGLGGLG